MARPTTISMERILKVARDLFLERGANVTTAEVARRAHIAEGSIFKRFPTKAHLFRAAMTTHLDEGVVPWIRTLREASEREDDPREVLIQVGTEAVEFFRRLVPLIMMSWSSSSRFGMPDFLEQPDAPPLRALKLLTRFFEREMRRGTMARHDPEVVARVFLGSIQSYVFFEILLKARDEMPMPVETYLRGLVRLIWQGAAPPEPSAKKRSRTISRKE